MADYVSYYSGDQIDEAVGRALPGGALDTGKAPAGFGLGEIPKAVSDWNLATENGWYYGRTNSPNNEYWFGFVTRNDATGNLVQTVYQRRSYDTCFVCARRSGYNGGFDPWEWDNPRLELGKEYRTTERYQGKPVYRKLIQYTQSSASPETGSISIPHGISNLDGMVSISAKAGIYPLPYVGSTGGITGVGAPNATSVGINTYKTSWSTAYAFTLDMRYTKTTD